LTKRSLLAALYIDEGNLKSAPSSNRSPQLKIQLLTGDTLCATGARHHLGGRGRSRKTGGIAANCLVIASVCKNLCKNEPISARALTNRRNSRIQAIYLGKLCEI